MVDNDRARRHESLEATYPEFGEGAVGELLVQADENSSAGQQARDRMVRLIQNLPTVPNEHVHVLKAIYEEEEPFSDGRRYLAARADRNMRTFLGSAEIDETYVNISPAYRTDRLTVGTITANTLLFPPEFRGSSVTACLGGIALVYSRDPTTIDFSFDRDLSPAGLTIPPKTNPETGEVFSTQERLDWLERLANNAGNFAIGPGIMTLLERQQTTQPNILYYAAVGAQINDVSLPLSVPEEVQKAARSSIFTAITLNLTKPDEIRVESPKPHLHRLRSVPNRDLRVALEVAGVQTEEDLDRGLLQTLAAFEAEEKITEAEADTAAKEAQNLAQRLFPGPR